MNVVTISITMLRNVIKNGIIMDTCGFKRNRKRSTTTTRERKPNFYSM
jgi:hypothetical protein